MKTMMSFIGGDLADKTVESAYIHFNTHSAFHTLLQQQTSSLRIKIWLCQLLLYARHINLNTFLKMFRFPNTTNTPS